MISCHMVCHSNSHHLSQIFTGLFMLHKAGEIALSQECRDQIWFDENRPQPLRDARYTHLLVKINRAISLYYDCHDSYEIDELAAADVDYYFKRSYEPSRLPPPVKARIFPLGLNYAVYSPDVDDFEEERMNAFPAAGKPQFRPTIENMRSSAGDQPDIGVLFMTRAWDPFDHPDRTPEKQAERIRINEIRARCIELLRDEFADRFRGGFAHTNYAIKNYRSVLLVDEKTSAKEHYFNLVSQYPVCVATTGLHESIGWAMGEYVAFSRAIVSQTLTCEIPGDFKQGANYLKFDSPERCVTAVRELLSDRKLMGAIMKNNSRYYSKYLRPDAMVRRTLRIALSNRSVRIVKDRNRICPGP